MLAGQFTDDAQPGKAFQAARNTGPVDAGSFGGLRDCRQRVCLQVLVQAQAGTGQPAEPEYFFPVRIKQIKCTACGFNYLGGCFINASQKIFQPAFPVAMGPDTLQAVIVLQPVQFEITDKISLMYVILLSL